MPVYRFVNPKRDTTDWRQKMEDLQYLRDELAEKGAIMTPYERDVFERDIKAQVEAIFPVAQAALLNEHESALVKIERAKIAKKIAQSHEVDRWEADKMASEIDLAHKRVNMALSAEYNSAWGGTTRATKLEQIMTEAKQSANLYTKRAIFEVIGSLSVQDGADRIEINRFTKEAQGELPKLRHTEELKKAEQDEQTARDEYIQVRLHTQEASILLGQGNPAGPMASGEFAAAMKRFQMDPKTGECTILTPEQVMKLDQGPQLRNYIASDPIPGEEG